MAGTLTLVDLPAEVLYYIVGLLEHPRDAAACIGASPALACVSPLDTAASYYRGRSEAALAAGLPLRVILALFAQWEMRPEYRHLPAAAVGGHVAVIDWLCRHLKRIPAYKTERIGKEVTRYIPAPDPHRLEHDPRTIPERSDPGAPISRQRRSGRAASHKRRLPQHAPQITPERPDPEAPIARKTASGRVYYSKWAMPFSTTSFDSSTEEEDAAVPSRVTAITKYNDSHSDHSRPSEDEVLLTEARAETGDDDDNAPWGYLVCAAAEAACLDHVAILRYLTTACPLVGEPHMLLDPDIVAEAARQGALATVTYMHDRRTRLRPRGGRTCNCPENVGKAAAETAQYAILRWMHAVQCSASPCNMTNLACAIKEGDERLVDAISDTLASGKHDPDREAQAAWRATSRYTDSVVARALTSAARQGHLRALAIAHARGFAPITATVLGIAASSGHLGVLRWAAGETVPGIEAHLAPTEPLPWDAQEVVWMAARPDGPNVDVLQWLADRPETRVHFDAFMARTLIAYGCHGAVLWMHDAGLVSLASWDSLETAVRARSSPDVLEAIIDRGAACSPLVMALAMSDCIDDYAVALLCERYGHGDLAEAIRLHGCGLRNSAIEWVHYNVPEVSVDRVIKAGDVFRTLLEQEGEPPEMSFSLSSSASDDDIDEHWSGTS
ncbi:hypothetical protein pneo_cds_720 [Pandoravirus neocaledonia]|uniref:Ankyrin repeat domain containing protein n=1 Tax=Pandoravirus neocaledonia TaxID=2107708 RepID=A0A2U7UD25_9VIRU|nr:hypothetical protein pneo_cds_720 [Pandoravirus neocaledonia]AVK76327.1 hypothetical protein pneo_cds_720 [Pandoravirus neocaledonia]